MNLGAEFLQWAVGIFGPVAVDRQERALRFLEEAIEVAHVEGISEVALKAVAKRVYANPPGDVGREIGQASATLEMLAANIGYSASAEGAREFVRVQAISKDVWQKRHKAKVDLGIAK